MHPVELRLRRPWRMNHKITAVLFACSEQALSQFAVEAGPWVPLPGQSRSLVSPLAQDGGETPTMSAALYVVLTERVGIGSVDRPGGIRLRPAVQVLRGVPGRHGRRLRALTTAR